MKPIGLSSVKMRLNYRQDLYLSRYTIVASYYVQKKQSNSSIFISIMIIIISVTCRTQLQHNVGNNIPEIWSRWCFACSKFISAHDLHYLNTNATIKYNQIDI